MAVIIPNVTNWSVTPQNGQEDYFTKMNIWLSESTNVIASLSTAITKINESNTESNDNLEEVLTARDQTVAARDEAVTAVATLTAGAIDDTTIASNKVFSNQYIESNYYDKTEVDTAISDSNQINTLTDKSTPDDTDNFALQEAGGDLKKVSYENLTKLSPNDNRVKTALNANGTAPIYACRAWVNFNGTGTVAIRASGNVSSITDNGVGNYTVNFTTAMVDSNYSFAGDGNTGSLNLACCCLSKSTTSCNIRTSQAVSGYIGSSAFADLENITFGIFR
ncbi:hypothetical protein ACOTVP_08610 [Aliarcobacter butzleri]